MIYVLSGLEELIYCVLPELSLLYSFPAPPLRDTAVAHIIPPDYYYIRYVVDTR